MVDEFTPVIAEIIIYPEEEKFIFKKVIKGHIRSPEHKLISYNRESTSK